MVEEMYEIFVIVWVVPFSVTTGAPEGDPAVSKVILLFCKFKKFIVYGLTLNVNEVAVPRLTGGRVNGSVL
jgi:hypothetical protein